MNYYEVLNIKTTASEKDIKKAYRILAKKYHPDTYEGNKEFAQTKMQEINVAYDTLSDAELKKEYDEKMGFNVYTPPKTQSSQQKNTSSKVSYGNKYDKDGVNYEVKYRPNTSRIKYDKNGYAESNYYTPNLEDDDDWLKHETWKDLKVLFKGKNLIYTIILLFIVISVLSLTLHKAKESIDQLISPTSSLYKQTNNSNDINDLELTNSKEETQRKIKESEKRIQDNFDSIVEDARNRSKESLEKYKNEISQQVSEIKKEDVVEMLNQIGITDKETQQDVINYINQLKSN